MIEFISKLETDEKIFVIVSICILIVLMTLIIRAFTWKTYSPPVSRSRGPRRYIANGRMSTNKVSKRSNRSNGSIDSVTIITAASIMFDE